MYSTDIYKQPFWAENSGFMTGRDPLGIQNSSITLYAAMLPGMTNLTQRLRYYGLYCWLLNEYTKLGLKTEEKILQHHYNFIRRAELTIAFFMLSLDSDVTSIVGSNFARKFMSDFNSKGSFNIAKGADKLKETKKGSVYWDYTSGALGQYYLGSLIALDLVEVSNKFFIIREKGKELAKAFEGTITEQCRKRFLEIIESGILYLNDIDILKDLSVTIIPIDSREWEIYKSILLEIDGQKFRTSENIIPSNRRETIRLYLDYTKGSVIDWFPQQQYMGVKDNKLDSDASFGWYYYYVNEAIHYCIETIFWGILVNLDGRSLPVSEYIQEAVSIISDGLSAELVDFDKLLSLGELIESLQNIDLPIDLSGLEELNKSEQNVERAMSFAFILFLKIFKSTVDNLDRVQEFENKYYLNFQKGRISEYFKLYITDNKDESLSHYLNLFIKSILNDHISTAYRKMGNGESNLLKFVIEDGMIGHIQTMTPRFTTPRLRTLKNILTDMGFISQSGKVTTLGEELLLELS